MESENADMQIVLTRAISTPDIVGDNCLLTAECGHDAARSAIKFTLCNRMLQA
jgi:hypothetical protein